MGPLAILAVLAVGLAAAVPWLGFVDLGVLSELGLQPMGCPTGDLGCTLLRPSGLLTLVLIASGGVTYGLAAHRFTSRGRASVAAGLTAVALLGASWAGYLLVADNPVVAAIHERLGVGLDELTPWIGIAEAFGITVFVASFVVLLTAALTARADRPLLVALAGATAAAVSFIGVVVLVDPVLGVRLGAETIGTNAMPWTALIGNAAAGAIGGFVGLRLMRQPR